MQTPLFAALFALFSLACQSPGTEKSVPNSLRGAAGPAVKIAAFPTSENQKAETQPLVFRSGDGGLTWQNADAGLPADAFVNCLEVVGDALFLGDEKGLFSRPARDFGPPVPTEWSLVERPGVADPRVYGLASSRDGLLVGNLHGEWRRQIDGPGEWPIEFDAVRTQIVRTALERPDGSTILGCEGGIFRSIDGGKSGWQRVCSANGIRQIVADGASLVALGPRGLFRSEDDGKTWLSTCDGFGEPTILRSVAGGTVAVFEGGSLVGSGLLAAKGPLVFRSEDGGKSWHQIAEKLPPGRISDLEQAGDWLFCGHEKGIFRSGDGGKNWELVCPPRNEKNRVILAAGSDGAIFAAMFLGC